MLVSTNFAVLKCLECQEVVKIEPGHPIEANLHTCKVAKKAEPVKKADAPKKDATKEKGFLNKVFN